jgi:phytoene dehydrogenase-like protein
VSDSDQGTKVVQELPAEVDVAVIGAGHNGLVAAGYLAKEGLKVAVVEAAERPGGMTASGYLIPEAPHHVINSCAVDIIAMLHSRVIGDLELKKHGLKMVKPDPAYVSLHPDGTSLALWKDPRRTAEEIKQFSRHDAAAYLEFTALLDGVVAAILPVLGSDTARPAPKALWRMGRAAVKHRKLWSDMIALVTGTATSAVEERFESPIVKGTLLNLAAGAGPVDLPGSGLGYLLLALIHRAGVARPIGGMQSLTDALVNRVEAGNGAVITGAPVAEILNAGGVVRGLRLEDGRVIRSKAVVSSADPWLTLRKLVPEGVVDRKIAARMDASAANATGSGPFKIDLALNEQIRTVFHRRDDGVDFRMPTLLLGTVESVRDSYATAARGDLPEDPALWIAAPSAEDSTQAPVGQESLYVYSLAAPLVPREGWESGRKVAVDQIMTKLGKYVEPLERAEIGRLVETPEDLGARLRVRDGCITHIDMGLMNSGPLRPAVGLGFGKTPLEGLFLGGSGMHPGGGVSGLPGRTAAERTARYLKKRA